MENNDFTLTKFRTCFGLHEDFFADMPLSNEIFIEKKLDVEAFKKKMIKHDMEEYSEFLLHFAGRDVFSEWRELIEDTHKKWLSRNDFIKDISKTLICLLSEDDGCINSIKIQRARNSITIKNEKIINSLITHLHDLYNNNEYNRNEITVNEEITIEKLTNALDDINLSTKNKAGAKNKNFIITEVGMYLSFLKRVDKYIHNNEGIENIEDIVLKSSDYRFINDCLVFFGLEDDLSTNTTNTTTPEKYLRGLLDPSRYESWVKYKQESGAYLIFNKSIEEIVKEIILLRELQTEPPLSSE